MGSAYAELITGTTNAANTVSSNTVVQKKFNADGTSLTITDSATLF